MVATAGRHLLLAAYAVLVRRHLLVAAALLAIHVATARPGRTEEPPTTPQRWAVVVAGLPGDEEYAASFNEITAAWTNWLTLSLKVAPERLLVLSGKAADAEMPQRRSATRESLAQTFQKLAEKIPARDSLWVLVLGHGHYDGQRAWLHVPGPDPDIADWARWLNALRCREQIIWLTQTSSGWWQKPLAKPGRIVITATEADHEENETEFPHALTTVFHAPPKSLDLNSDRHVSLAELFRATVKETNARFAGDQRVPTEHAQLDDDANGQGTESDQLADENATASPLAKSAKPAKPERPRDGREAANIIVLDVSAN